MLGLYKGLGGSLVHVVPNVSVNLSAYVTLRSYWIAQQPENVSPKYSIHFTQPAVDASHC